MECEECGSDDLAKLCEEEFGDPTHLCQECGAVLDFNEYDDD